MTLTRVELQPGKPFLLGSQSASSAELQMCDLTPVTFLMTNSSVPWALTFLHHSCSNGELGGVVGSAMAFGLPGLLLGYDQLLPLLDG